VREIMTTATTGLDHRGTTRLRLSSVDKQGVVTFKAAAAAAATMTAAASSGSDCM